MPFHPHFSSSDCGAIFQELWDLADMANSEIVGVITTIIALRVNTAFVV